MIFFLIFFALCLNVFADDFDITAPNEKSFYIIDGDSISLQMRIKGIDTPEIRQRCQENKGVYVDCGLLARNALDFAFKKSKGKVRIKNYGFDSYNRMLVKLYRDNNIDIGREMVRAGVAFSYGNEYKKEEELAKSEKLGFWSYYQIPIKPKIWRNKNNINK